MHIFRTTEIKYRFILQVQNYWVEDTWKDWKLKEYEKVNNLWKNFILYLPSPANQPQNQQNPEKNTLYYIREQLRWNAHTGCMINNNLIGAKWTTNEAYALFLKQVKQAQSFTMYETPNTWWENLARKSI